MSQHIIIIGGGQAGLQVCASLRQGGFDGAISLFGAEAYLPYQRPPLSKAYLSGAMERERLFLKPQNFFDENNISLHLQCEVQEIDAKAQTIKHSNGEASYDALVFATGSRPREFPLAPPNAKNIFNLRGIDDINAMKPLFDAGKNPAIIGGGYIGLEAAAVSAASGASPIVYEAAPRLLARVAEPEISSFYKNLHEAEGVRVITDAEITGLEGEQNISAVQCGGATHETDFVICGIGILPNTELASTAGIATDATLGGISVDEFGCTNTQNIYAAGDCTAHPNPLLGRRLRLESVPNAIEQAKAVASHICGQPQPYVQVPWFWSDQYDVKMQMAGVPNTIDKKLLRGDDNTRSFAWFYFAGEQLVAAIAINRPAEFMASRQLIAKAAEGFIVDANKLADETSHPKEWLK